MRIVIVEDEIKIRTGMAKMIENETDHIIVGLGSNGEEGLEIIQRFKPDLVITDIRMPNLDGLEMLEKMYERKIQAQTIILSGYSEFSYAQKAIRFGVTDYLLKPLAPEDLLMTLDKVVKQMQAEEKENNRYAESQLGEFLFGKMENTTDSAEKIRELCGVELDSKVLIYAGYVGDAPSGYRELVEKELWDIREKYVGFNLYWFYQENIQIYFCVITAIDKGVDFLQIERTFYNRLMIHYQKCNEKPIWAMHYTKADQLKESVWKIREWIPYTLVLKEKGFIQEEDIVSIQKNDFKYPVEIIKDIKRGICSESIEQMRSGLESFYQYMLKLQIEPAEVKGGFIKLYYEILDVLLDFNKPLHDEFKDTNFLKILDAAVSENEVRNAYQDIVKLLLNAKTEREDISNYIIKKAINHIRENYKEGITLEETARKLKITPVYLSTLFNREVGINFSSFLKQFRMSQAKRLLKGSDLKIYEVAKEVGYQDPKYFAKVFKEELGVSPGDYRQES
ncbi:YesN/AraC family two-component response regulator [Aequitasia blattaphilus]|uniref:Stage 0 sporulation protein A homolog n=1 Tax=Aequitasia blattaphilus TaxID=2949332 RepID=A0ABT1EF04_9FIRM|nr:response regulator [Aequitasia blattaphilus]MCP1103517.1 response regulator [Aequitasia blattaphilus]MCR8616157.1 response regulator [Aequitasia blattaphilus]